jgi:alanyl-tRNA synthetase
MGDDPNDPENSAPLVNAHGDTIMEIWNLVFMQFDRSETEQGKYKLTPLPAPSVDTGAGLERLAVVMQGVKSNYDTDLIRPIVEFTAQLAGRRYEPETQEGFALRAVADHARATAFSIADGILPAGEGRNYVLRKIMRRAIYHGRFRLGFEGLFFYKVTNFVIDQMKGAYPELEAGRGFIEKMVRLEEERFKNTLTVGLKKLDELFSARSFHDLGKANEAFQSIVKDLACLYDTFGTPRDLMRLSLEERGFQISEEDFNEAVDSAVRSLQVSDTLTYSKKVKVAKTKSIYIQVAEQVEQSQFKGYETTRDDDAKVVALIKGDEEVNSLNEGDEGEVVLSHTPFYAESGGQVGDVGTLETAANASVEVLDTHSPAQGLIVHKVKVEKGSLKVGASCFGAS